jgi:hypothetical protein
MRNYAGTVDDGRAESSIAESKSVLNSVVERGILARVRCCASRNSAINEVSVYVDSGNEINAVW